MAGSQLFGNLLIHLTLEDSFGHPAIEVGRLPLTASERLEHLSVECPGNEVLKGIFEAGIAGRRRRAVGRRHQRFDAR